jgi:hypothetical protein
MYEMATSYSKWLSNIPNGRNIHQNFPFQGPPKYYQTGIFGSKVYHLATLVLNPCAVKWAGRLPTDALTLKHVFLSRRRFAAGIFFSTPSKEAGKKFRFFFNATNEVISKALFQSTERNS